jgi:Tfp pilus assembly protein PilZ
MDKPRDYKRTRRYTKRLEATFSSGNLSFRGILSNISESGLFIRTNRGFTPGTVVEIEVMMPDNTISHLKGVVRRTIKTPLTSMKNGMGIELTERDEGYSRFVHSVIHDKESEDTPYEFSVPEYKIIPCPKCGAKNKVPNEKLALGPKCGKCKTPLLVDPD